MKITLLEKIMLANTLPTEGNIKTMVILKDLRKKIELTQDNIKDYDIQVLPTGALQWNKEGAEVEFDIQFTELETIEVTLAIKKLDKEKKLSIDMLSLVEKFNVTPE